MSRSRGLSRGAASTAWVASAIKDMLGHRDPRTAQSAGPGAQPASSSDVGDGGGGGGGGAPAQSGQAPAPEPASTLGLDDDAATLFLRGSGASGHYGNFSAGEEAVASLTRRASVRRLAAETSFSAETFALELAYNQLFPLSVPLMAWLEGGVAVALANRMFIVPVGAGAVPVFFCLLQAACCVGFWVSVAAIVLAYTVLDGTEFADGVKPMATDVAIANVLWMLRNLVVATKYAYVPRVEYNALRRRPMSRAEHVLRMMNGGWRDPLGRAQVARELMLSAMRRRVVAAASAGGFMVSPAGGRWWMGAVKDAGLARADSDGRNSVDSGGGGGGGDDGSSRDEDKPAGTDEYSMGGCSGSDSQGAATAPDGAGPRLSRRGASRGSGTLAQELLDALPPGGELSAALSGSALYGTSNGWLRLMPGEARAAGGSFAGAALARCPPADAAAAAAGGVSYVPTRILAAYLVHAASGGLGGHGSGVGDVGSSGGGSEAADWAWWAAVACAVLGSLISPLWRLTGGLPPTWGTWAVSVVIFPMSFFGLLSSALFCHVAAVDFARRARLAYLLNSLLVGGVVGGEPPEYEQPIVVTSRRADLRGETSSGAGDCGSETEVRRRMARSSVEARLTVHWGFPESAHAWLAARQLLQDFGRMYLSRVKLFTYFYAAYVIALVALIFGALIADNSGDISNTDGFLITAVLYNTVLFLALLARVAFNAGSFNDVNQRQVTSLAALRMALRRRMRPAGDFAPKFPNSEAAETACELERESAALEALGIAAEAVGADNATSTLRVVGFNSGESLVAFISVLVGAAAAIGAEQIYSSVSE